MPDSNALGDDAFGLSPRETEVVVLLAKGWANKQIARKLHISDQTVKSHLSRIYTKMKVGTRTEAVVKAIEYGVLECRPRVKL